MCCIGQEETETGEFVVYKFDETKELLLLPIRLRRRLLGGSGHGFSSVSILKQEVAELVALEEVWLIRLDTFMLVRKILKGLSRLKTQ